MCRNIKPLFNFQPPATDEEVHLSSLQFIRKISGFSRPSKANEPAFLQAVDDVSMIARRLIDALQTQAPPRNREIEAARSKERSSERFGM